MEHEYQKISSEQLQLVLDQAFKIIQRPLSCCSDDELNTLMKIISNTLIFHRIVGHQIHVKDVLQHMKSHINYHKYPYGTIITHEGSSVSELNVIIKGKALRFQPKPDSKIRKEEIKSLFSIDENQEDSQIEKEKVMELLQQKTKNVEKAEKTPSVLDRFRKCVQIAGRIKTLHEQIKSPSPKKLVLQKLSSLLLDLDQETDEIKEEEDIMNPVITPINNEKARKRFKRTRTFGSLNSLPQESSPKKGSKTENEFSSNINNVLSSLILELQEVEKETEQKEEEKDESPRKAQLRKQKEKIALENEMKLLEHVKNNELNGRKYFAGEFCKVERQKEYQPGSYFGEHFLKPNKPKENLLIASEDLHVLTITRESVAEVLTELYEKSVHKAKYFQTIFPNLKEDKVKAFSYLFREKMIHKDEKIYVEGENPSFVCLLRSGNVKLMKKIEMETKEKLSNTEHLLINAHKSNKMEFSVSSIVEGQFFGEELLLQEEKRHFTAMAIASGTIIYFLDKMDYLANKAHLADLLQRLASQAKEKVYWRFLRLEGIIGRMKEQSPKQVAKTHNEGFGKFSDLNAMAQNKMSPMQESNHSKHLSPREKQLRLTQEGKHLEPIISPKRYGKINESNHELELSKNLTIYKERFSRKVLEKVKETKAFQRTIRSEKNLLSEPFFDRTSEALISPKRPLKKNLYLSSKNSGLSNKIDHSPSDYAIPLSSLHSITSPRLTSLDFLQADTMASISNLQKTKAIQNNILQFLAPNKTGDEDENIVKNFNGTFTVVSCRSRLRTFLKTLEQAPVLHDALQSPRNGGQAFSLVSQELREVNSNNKGSPRVRRFKIKKKIHDKEESVYSSNALSPRSSMPSMPKSCEIPAFERNLSVIGFSKVKP